MSNKTAFLFFIASLTFLKPVSAAGGIEKADFSFIHASDVHAPSETSRQVIEEIVRSTAQTLAPYGIETGKPDFAVVSGDLTEFGGGAGAWSEYLSYWAGADFPVYHELGNHDGPWFSNRPYLRRLYGACSWSFDRGGFHFIGLDTSTPHDPRANITEEQFAWLKRDLAKLKPDTPVFLVLHHPLNDVYFGSPDAVLRLLDLLRPYNLVAALVGHGHRADVQDYFGVDNIQGGSTIGPVPRIPAGYNVVSVRGGMLRVASRLQGESKAANPVIEKKIPERARYPKINISSPGENENRQPTS